MKAQEFLQKLKNPPAGSVESVEQYWRRQREDWITDLSKLRKQVKLWIAPVEQGNGATTTERSYRLDEPDTGGYDAPGLEIQLLSGVPKSIELRPRGLRVLGIVETDGKRVFGANGRVDLECGSRREILLRFVDEENTNWMYYSNGEKRELDDELFFELLSNLVDVA